MSDNRKINDDELNKLLKESLQFNENEVPVVTPELMDKTLKYIMENKDIESKESTPAKPRRTYIYWISGAAACLVLLAGAMLVKNIGVISPDKKSNSSEMVMEDSVPSDFPSESDDWDVNGSVPEEYDTADFDSAGSAAGSSNTDGSADGNSTDSNSTDSNSTISNSADDNFAADISDSEESVNFSDTESEDETFLAGKNSGKVSSNKPALSGEIVFPENILGCSVEDLDSIMVETANGETLIYESEDILPFCRKLEKEFSSKKEEYKTNSAAYHELPNDWEKKILIQSENISGEYEFHKIFTYEDCFAVCPFPDTETDPNTICTIYE